jgi:hypothetical protein
MLKRLMSTGNDVALTMLRAVREVPEVEHVLSCRDNRK